MELRVVSWKAVDLCFTGDVTEECKVAIDARISKKFQLN